jgi:hypothetical protein
VDLAITSEHELKIPGSRAHMARPDKGANIARVTEVSNNLTGFPPFFGLICIFGGALVAVQKPFD